MFVQRCLTRNKHLAILIVTNFIAINVLAIGFYHYTTSILRQTTLDESNSVAELIQHDIAPFLMDDKQLEAANRLMYIYDLPRIKAVYVFDRHGQLFASSTRDGSNVELTALPEYAKPSGYHFIRNQLEVTKTISLGGQIVGTVLVQSRLNQIDWLVLWVLIVIVLTLLLVALLSSRFRQSTVAQEQASQYNGHLEKEVRQQTLELNKALEGLKRASKKAQEANKAKDELIANMSHEIRTPLNCVIGMTELALNTDLTIEQRDYLESSLSSAEALLSLINGMLDLSRIDAGKLECCEEEFRLIDMLYDWVRPFAMECGQRGLAFSVQVDGNLPSKVIGDQVRTRQVLVNLIGNAVKFTDQGSVEIKLELHSRDEHECNLLFTVRDTGVGIPQEKQKAIFNAFVQCDGSASRRHEGAGLGLSISSELANLLGGKIWVESCEGQGSTFYFSLRLRTVAKNDTIYSGFDLTKLAGSRALVVTSNRFVDSELRRILTDWRCDVDVVSAIDDCLQRLMNVETPYGLLFVDASDDLDVLRANLEQVDEAPNLLSTIKLLLVSPGTMQNLRPLTLELNSYRRVWKPIDPQELYYSIADAISLKTASNEEVPQPAKGKSHQGLRVLLADDNPLNSKLLDSILSKQGYHVTCVNNGALVLEELEQRSYDLLLLDLHMPVLDGIKAAQYIRAADGRRFQHVPIISISADTREDILTECGAVGINFCLAKPVRKDALFAAIDEVLGVESRNNIDDAKDVAYSDIIDLQFISDHFGDDGDFIREIIDLFLSESIKSLDAIRVALQKKHAEDLTREAHTLKGSVSHFGARGAVDLAAAIEDCGRAGDIDGAGELFEQLCSECATLSHVLTQLRADDTVLRQSAG